MTNDPLLHHAERLRRDAAALERSAAIEPPEMRPTPYHVGALRVVPDGLPPPDAEGLGEESAERIAGLADASERALDPDGDGDADLVIDGGDPATVEWGGLRVVTERPPVEGLDIGRAQEPPGAAWPDPPAPAAYHGLAGDLVGAVRDRTEADPIAILGSVLSIFGCCCGHGRTFYQGSPQAANLFVVLVGDTSVGRKGTGHHVASVMFDAAWPDWRALLVPRLGSGEGLIGHLKRSEGKEHRALVLETEFGRLLRVMARDGSTLSPMLRDAWDGVPLGRFLAREGALVPWHHVGALVHVTPEELRDKLTSTDAANGFGNRFLWLAVRRTRLLPFPASPGPFVAPYVGALHRAIEEAQQPRELGWAPVARSRWAAVYEDLSERRRVGLSGALTARAEAQVARLALVHALLDRAEAIEPAHLDAACALWDYAERSVTHIFGTSLGDPLADWMIDYLREASATRTELRRESGVHDAARLSAAIGLLVRLGLVRATKGKASTKGGRRPETFEVVPDAAG